jgi:hypothetical protein
VKGLDYIFQLEFFVSEGLFQFLVLAIKNFFFTGRHLNLVVLDDVEQFLIFNEKSSILVLILTQPLLQILKPSIIIVLFKAIVASLYHFDDLS